MVSYGNVKRSFGSCVSSDVVSILIVEWSFIVIMNSKENNFSNRNSWVGKDEVAAVLYLKYSELGIFFVIVDEVVGI